MSDFNLKERIDYIKDNLFRGLNLFDDPRDFIRCYYSLDFSETRWFNIINSKHMNATIHRKDYEILLHTISNFTIDIMNTFDPFPTNVFREPFFSDFGYFGLKPKLNLYFICSTYLLAEKLLYSDSDSYKSIDWLISKYAIDKEEPFGKAMVGYNYYKYPSETEPCTIGIDHGETSEVRESYLHNIFDKLKMADNSGLWPMCQSPSFSITPKGNRNYKTICLADYDFILYFNHYFSDLRTLKSGINSLKSIIIANLNDSIQNDISTFISSKEVSELCSSDDVKKLYALYSKKLIFSKTIKDSKVNYIDCISGWAGMENMFHADFINCYIKSMMSIKDAFLDLDYSQYDYSILYNYSSELLLSCAKLPIFIRCDFMRKLVYILQNQIQVNDWKRLSINIEDHQRFSALKNYKMKDNYTDIAYTMAAFDAMIIDYYSSSLPLMTSSFFMFLYRTIELSIEKQRANYSSKDILEQMLDILAIVINNWSIVLDGVPTFLGDSTILNLITPDSKQEIPLFIKSLRSIWQSNNRSCLLDLLLPYKPNGPETYIHYV